MLAITAAPYFAFGQCDQNPMAIICDNFESYNVGLLSPQSPWWIPWSGPEDGVPSAAVSTDHASQGTKAMKVAYESAAGDDQVLLLGNKTAGRFELQWKMYIPSGNAGYFNVQNNETPGQKWNLDVYFDSIGTARMIINAQSPTQPANATFAYPHDQWFTLRMYFDLDNNIAKMFSGGNLILGWAYPDNIGGIDFYAATMWDLYYIDEVEYVQLPGAVFNVDACDAAVDLTQFFGQASTVVQTTGIYDNTNATVSPTDPMPDCWSNAPGGTLLNNTMWYTFTGDGGKYHIETVPCNSTTYIGTNLPLINGSDPDGDTQMAIYTGACGDLTQVDCNDDLNLNGEPDWRAAVDLQTSPGQNYYMMIDGFDYGNGLVATGQFCIEITKQPQILCSEGAVGTYTLDNNGFLCFGSDVLSLINLGMGYSIPDVGPEYGMGWAITSVPVPNGVYPPTLGANFIDGTNFLPQPFVFSSPNNNPATVQPFVVYITPVVIAGGTVINPANPKRMINIDPITNGCVYTGASMPVIFTPVLPPLAGFGVSTPAGPGNTGTIDLAVEGGIAQLVGDPQFYLFNWSNSETTQNLSGLAAGPYTVTISDLSNCTPPVVVSVQVTTPTKDPVSVKALTINPNPTTGIAQLNLELAQAVSVRIEIVNTLGQSMQTIDGGKTDMLNQTLDLSNLNAGTYFLRVIMDGETALRRLVLQR